MDLYRDAAPNNLQKCVSNTLAARGFRRCTKLRSLNELKVRTRSIGAARIAQLLAARKAVEDAGGSWDPLRGYARVDSSSSPPEPDEAEVECLGESTRAEAEAARDAAGRAAAVDLDE